MTSSPERRPAPVRLRVGIVGAGRVGAVLGAALDRAGHRVVALSARSDASLARAAALLPQAAVRSPLEVVSGSELVVLAVGDDALPTVVAELAAAVRPGTLVAHTSGRYGVGVLEPVAAAGGLPLALHPAMTFTGTSLDLERLAGAVFGVTASGPVAVAGQALVLEMGGEPVLVADELRPLYHAALAHGANHLVTLVGQAADLLRAVGVEFPQAVLRPLLTAALDGALLRGDGALTGPVARGDAGTVAAHLAALDAAAVGSGDPQVRACYLALARATVDRALASGRLSSAQAEPMLGVLAGRVRA